MIEDKVPHLSDNDIEQLFGKESQENTLPKLHEKIHAWLEKQDLSLSFTNNNFQQKPDATKPFSLQLNEYKTISRFDNDLEYLCPDYESLKLGKLREQVRVNYTQLIQDLKTYRESGDRYDHGIDVDASTQLKSLYVEYLVRRGFTKDAEKILDKVASSVNANHLDHDAIVSNALISVFRYGAKDAGTNWQANYQLDDAMPAIREWFRVAEVEENYIFFDSLVSYMMSEDADVVASLPDFSKEVRDLIYASFSRLSAKKGDVSRAVWSMDYILDDGVWLDLVFDIFAHSAEAIDPGEHEALGMYLVNEINERVMWDQRKLDDDEPGVVSSEFSKIGKIYGESSPRKYTISPLDFFDTRIRMARLPNCPENLYSVLLYGKEKNVLSLAYIIEEYLEPEDAVDEWGELFILAGEKKDSLFFESVAKASRDHIHTAKEDVDELFDSLYKVKMYAHAMMHARETISYFDTEYKDEFDIFSEWRIPATILCVENIDNREECLELISDFIDGILSGESEFIDDSDDDDIYVDDRSAMAREELRIFFHDLFLLAVRQNRMDVVEEVLAHPIVEREDVATALHCVVEANRTNTKIRLSFEA